MADEIIEELWRIKDEVAKEHGYDLEDLVTALRASERWPRLRVEEVPSPPQAPNAVETDR